MALPLFFLALAFAVAVRFVHHEAEMYGRNATGLITVLATIAVALTIAALAAI